MFSIAQSQYGHRGFTIKFPNGIEVSVAFGRTNYCDNRHSKETPNKCIDCEVALFRADQQIGTTHSYVDAMQLLSILSEAADMEARPLYSMTEDGVIVDHPLLSHEAIKYTISALWERYQEYYMECDQERENIYMNAINFYKENKKQ